MTAKQLRVTRPSRFLVWLSPCLLVFLAGCGSKTTVSGKVSYQGRPVIYGSVIIQNSPRHAASGVIQPDGTYTVEGVQPGDVIIAVVSRDPSKGRSGQRVDKELAKKWFPLPLKYEDPMKSGIMRTIDSKDVHCDLDLTP